MPKVPRTFLGMLAVSWLRSCPWPTLKNLVPHSPVWWGVQQIPLVADSYTGCCGFVQLYWTIAVLKRLSDCEWPRCCNKLMNARNAVKGRKCLFTIWLEVVAGRKKENIEMEDLDSKRKPKKMKFLLFTTAHIIQWAFTSNFLITKSIS